MCVFADSASPEAKAISASQKCTLEERRIGVIPNPPAPSPSPSGSKRESSNAPE
jgi:hypothetical protein